MTHISRKLRAIAAVTKAVVGVGAVVIGAVALSEKKNQIKVKKAFTKAKGLVHKYAKKSEVEVEQGKSTIKKALKKKVRSI